MILARTPIVVPAARRGPGDTRTSRGLSYCARECAGCPLNPRCTPAKERRVKRWEHEAVLDAMQERLDRAPETMRI